MKKYPEESVIQAKIVSIRSNLVLCIVEPNFKVVLFADEPKTYGEGDNILAKIKNISKYNEIEIEAC